MSQKRILFYGASPTVPRSLSSTAQRFQASGANFGNLMIGYSTLQIADFAPCSRGLSFERDQAAELHQEWDLIVISASNFLNAYSDFGTEADFLEKVRLPIVVLGLGSQADLHFSSKIPLRPGTEKFIRVLAEKSVCLGVRGEFTMDQLARLQIHNATPIGCPSYYLRPSAVPSLAAPKPPPDDTNPRFIFNSDPTIFSDPATRPGLVEFHQWCIRAGGFFIGQNESFLWQGESGVPDEVSKGLTSASRFFGLPDAETTSRFLREKCRVYWEIPAWLEAMKSQDFVIGPRFHGGMLALQSGVPVRFITHDSRTWELTQCLGLPACSVQEILRETSPREVWLNTSYQLTALKYPDLLRRFLGFLDTNGFPAKSAWRQEAESVARSAS